MSDSTSVLIGSKARKKILAGVNKVYEAIKPTLGPAGKSALLPRTFNRGSRHVDDGYFIAENVRPKDKFERLSADSFKESIKKTNELVGDGTTTTGIIGGHLINKVFREMDDADVPSATLNGKKGKKTVRQIRQEMKDAKDLVISKVKEMSKPVKSLADLEKLSLVSIGKEDELAAKTIAKMVWEIGRDANGNFIDNHIDVVEGYKGELETETVRGMRFPAKVAHKIFVTKPERFEMVAEQVSVLITNHKLDNPFQIVALLDRVRVPKIAIFAPSFSPGVLKSLIETTKNGLFCYPILCPALRTEQLEDLASYTLATVIDKDNNKKLETVSNLDLGWADKIIVKDTENKEDAVLLGGKGDNSTRVKERMDILKKQIKESRNDLTRISLEKRIANLSSAIGIIRVGATTEKESLYLKLKIEDGVYACKAGLQEGYVKGGGLCLKEIAELLPENILTETLKAPYEQIQKNAGGIEIGKEIIDSSKVVRLVVEHGVSTASTMITTDMVIADDEEITPGEGYAEIAKAITLYATYWAKQQGIVKENEDEAEEDRNREFERILSNDK